MPGKVQFEDDGRTGWMLFDRDQRRTAIFVMTENVPAELASSCREVDADLRDAAVTAWLEGEDFAQGVKAYGEPRPPLFNGL